MPSRTRRLECDAQPSTHLLPGATMTGIQKVDKISHDCPLSMPKGLWEASISGRDAMCSQHNPCPKEETHWQTGKPWYVGESHGHGTHIIIQMDPMIDLCTTVATLKFSIILGQGVLIFILHGALKIMQSVLIKRLYKIS